MATRRKSWALALAAITVAVIGVTGALHLWVGERGSDERDQGAAVDHQSKDESSALGYGAEIREKAKSVGSDVSERLKPVITWKMRMLRYMGW